MFVLNDDMSIYATRGDTVFFTVTATDGNGANYKFKPDDVVRFKAFEKKACENVVAQKDFVITEETEEVSILLTEDDTRFGKIISKPRDYWYEIELNPFTNPQTIIGYDDDGPKVFRLYPESKNIVKDISEEDLLNADAELSLTSTNPIQNQAVTRAVANLSKHIDDGLKDVKESVLSEEEALRIRGELRVLDSDVASLKSDFTEYQTSTNNSIKQTNDKVNVLESRSVNNNILINSNFANPVNQRGETTKTNTGYWIDRWFINNLGDNANAVITDDCIRINKGDNNNSVTYFLQKIEFPEKLIGKVLTLSAKINGTIYAGTIDFTGSKNEYRACSMPSGNMYLYYDYNNNVLEFDISINAKHSITIEWVKLEIGDHATPYVPRLYAEELALCKRYYKKEIAYITPIEINENLARGVHVFNCLFSGMRIRPTITLENSMVTNAGAIVDGFAISKISNGDDHIQIEAKKNSHGLKEIGIRISATLIMDAEL